MRLRIFLSLAFMALSPAIAQDGSLHSAVHPLSLQDAAVPSGTNGRDNVTTTTQMKSQSAPVAPLQIELRFLLRIPPSEAFDLVTNRLPEWFGAIHSVQWDHTHSTAGPGQTGACSERVCDFGGKALREEIVAFEAGRSYTYRADMARSEMKMPLYDHLGSFEVEPAEDGSLIIWRQYFRPRWFMPGFLLRWQMRDRMMRPAVEGLIARHGGRWVSVRPSGAA